uniref:Uncharacterized protein n=1 Tax=Pundamilia nyererei TaxID=303518 RepID=A0A3B4FDF7_9CICH
MQKPETKTSKFFTEVAVSIKTGDTERINSPVSKNRLIEMYRKLKLLQWPKIKKNLKSNNLTPEFTKGLIQVKCRLSLIYIISFVTICPLQTPLLKSQTQYSQDVIMNLRLLASECYWLGCLMALNNPPLQPDWQNHIPGMDPWDILPRDIKSF